jgi:hypothetical protein
MRIRSLLRDIRTGFREGMESAERGSNDNQDLIPSYSRTPLYRYKSLQDARSIRLLVIEPGKFGSDLCLQLIHVPLSKNPHYEALSYTWGDGSYTSSVSIDGGSTLKIGESNTCFVAHRFLL